MFRIIFTILFASILLAAGQARSLLKAGEEHNKSLGFNKTHGFNKTLWEEYKKTHNKTHGHYNKTSNKTHFDKAEPLLVDKKP